MVKFILFILSSLMALSLHGQEARKWLLSDGMMFEASVVSADASTVKLKAESGKVASVPLQKLSVTD